MNPLSSLRYGAGWVNQGRLIVIAELSTTALVRVVLSMGVQVPLETVLASVRRTRLVALGRVTN